MSLDVQRIREEFPALQQLVNGHPLIYLDSAATSLKPQAVIDRMTRFYSLECSNVHRGAHFLSDRATDLYEKARESVARFIGAKSAREILFVRGTTEGINLIAHSLSEQWHAGDEIIVSDIEHHANIVPWQMLAERKNLTIKVLKASVEGEFALDDLRALITPRTKVLAITHASNHLGNVVSIQELIAEAHRHKVLVVVDGAQAIGKMSVDVSALDADFYVFSGHKMFAPFGIGVVFGKEQLLSQMPPYQGGGSMIAQVSFAKTTFNDIPFRFEAGTPNVGGAIGLAAAIQYIEHLGFEAIEEHEQTLVSYALERLLNEPGLNLLGPQNSERIPVFAFNLEGLHGSDVGFILNQEGIAVRTGHHCTQPLLQKLNITGSIRASFSIYNTIEEVDALIKGIHKAKDLLT